MRIPIDRTASGFFHGDRDEWERLTDRQRRYVLANMNEQEMAELAAPPSLDVLREWTRADIERENTFGESVIGRLAEVSEFTAWTAQLLDEHEAERVSDLPPDVLSVLQTRTFDLFGTTDLVRFVDEDD